MILTEQEILHFNKQNTIACSLQPSAIIRTAVGNPPGLRGGCSSWEWDYHTCQFSLLRLPTASALSDISMGWTQGSLSGSTPPSALPNSENISGALWGLIEADGIHSKRFSGYIASVKSKTLSSAIATLSMDCSVRFSYLWFCTLVSAFSHCSLLACVTHSSRIKPSYHRGKEPISEVLNIGFQLPLS